MDATDQDQVILRGFGNALTRAGLAPSSRAKYLQHARHFIVWLGSRHPAHISRAEAEEYLDTLGGENFSVATFRVRIAALRKLYRYLEDRGHLIDESGRDVRNPFERVELPRRRQRANDWLREDEDRALLSAPLTWPEKIVVYVLRWTGLRVSEACALKVSDVDFSRGEIRVRDSKSAAGMRTVPIAPELEPVLDLWITT